MDAIAAESKNWDSMTRIRSLRFSVFRSGTGAFWSVSFFSAFSTISSVTARGQPYRLGKLRLGAVLFSNTPQQFCVIVRHIVSPFHVDLFNSID